MRFVLLLIAAVIAVVAGIAALQWSGKMNAPAPTAPAAQVVQPTVNTVDVLVARAPIPVGTLLDDSMVDKQPWPEHLVLDNFIVVGGKNDDVAGKVARAPFQAHEPLTLDKLANPNDPSFLAANLPQGMRAVTIATDAVAGVAGYVFPGDHIDILFTHNVPQDVKNDAQSQMGMGMRATGKPAISEVLVNNVRVLAVNVRDLPGRGNQQTTVPSSVTVELKEWEAQKIRLAEKVGTLSIALRSIKDLDTDTAPVPTALQTLSRVPMEAQKANSIRIVRGVGDRSSQATPLARALSSVGMGAMSPGDPE